VGFILSAITYAKRAVLLSNFNKYLCEFVFNLYHAKHETHLKKYYLGAVTVLD